MHAAREFTTTLTMSSRQRVGLDALRTARAVSTGRRPSTRSLLCEAIELLLLEAGNSKVRRPRRRAP